MRQSVNLFESVWEFACLPHQYGDNSVMPGSREFDGVNVLRICKPGFIGAFGYQQHGAPRPILFAPQSLNPDIARLQAESIKKHSTILGQVTKETLSVVAVPRRIGNKEVPVRSLLAALNAFRCAGRSIAPYSHETLAILEFLNRI
jgi:hypothetical protein